MAKKKGIVPQITFKSLLDPIKDIDKRNKKFASLSAEGKRLETAWEALKLVTSGIAEPAGSDGRSFYWDHRLKGTFNRTASSKELQEEFLNLQSCTVCERGILTLSRIRLGNGIDPCKYSVFSISEGYEIKARDGFSYLSFEQMEKEYERSFYCHPYNSNTSKKMANILCNVLVNGDFNTEDKTNYLTRKS